MTWAKLDDNFPAHPKLAQIGDLMPLVGWLHVCAICYCSRYLTNGFITRKAARTLSDFQHIGIETATGGGVGFGHDVEVLELIDMLVLAGLWHDMGGGTYEIHDYLDYNPSREQVLADREIARTRKAMNDDPTLRKAIRKRDGNTCRYCGTTVNWADRRGPTGGTYDHVIPISRGGSESLDNLVVCCRGCNSRKRGISLEDSGFVLLAPRQNLGPTQVHIRKPVPVPVLSPVTPKNKDKGLSLIDESVRGYWCEKAGREPTKGESNSLAVLSKKYSPAVLRVAIGQAVAQGDSADNFALITKIAKKEVAS